MIIELDGILSLKGYHDDSNDSKQQQEQHKRNE